MTGVFVFEIYDGDEIACICGSNEFVPSPSLEDWFLLTEKEQRASRSTYFCAYCGRRFIDFKRRIFI